MFAAILAYLISDLEEDGIGGLTVGPTSSLVLLRFVDWVAIVCEEACLPLWRRGVRGRDGECMEEDRAQGRQGAHEKREKAHMQ